MSPLRGKAGVVRGFGCWQRKLSYRVVEGGSTSTLSGVRRGSFFGRGWRLWNRLRAASEVSVVDWGEKVTNPIGAGTERFFGSVRETGLAAGDTLWCPSVASRDGGSAREEGSRSRRQGSERESLKGENVRKAFDWRASCRKRLRSLLIACSEGVTLRSRRSSLSAASNGTGGRGVGTRFLLRAEQSLEDESSRALPG